LEAVYGRPRQEHAAWAAKGLVPSGDLLRTRTSLREASAWTSRHWSIDVRVRVRARALWVARACRAAKRLHGRRVT
jgi:hypothetical protein